MAIAPEEANIEEADPPSSREPDGPGEYPPEIRALSRGEMRRLFEDATLVALDIAGSRDLASKLVSDVFLKLATTRRWDPKSGPLIDHIKGALKSELSNWRKKVAAAVEAQAGADYERQVRPTTTPSAEHMMLEHAEAQDEKANAPRRQAQAANVLATLHARVADHPLAPRVLQCHTDGITKPADIARTLNVPAKSVYRALELIRDNLTKIRASLGDATNEPEDT